MASKTKCVLFLLLAVALLGCGDSASRRKQAAAELRMFASQFRADSTEVAPLNAIIEVLENGCYSFDRTYACGVLRELGPDAKPAIPALIKALNCGDIYVEREAPRALGAMGKTAAEAVPELVNNLRKTNRDAGWFSATALGDIGAPALTAIPELEIASQSSAGSMVESAQKALDKLRALDHATIAE